MKKANLHVAVATQQDLLIGSLFRRFYHDMYGNSLHLCETTQWHQRLLINKIWKPYY